LEGNFKQVAPILELFAFNAEYLLYKVMKNDIILYIQEIIKTIIAVVTLGNQKDLNKPGI